MSNILDGINITGDVHIEVYDENGILKQKKDIPNLVVTTGKYYVAAKLAGITTGEGVTISHMAIGTGGAATASGDVALVSQLGTRQALISLTHTTGTTTLTASASFTPGIITIISEAGLFNSSTGVTSNMICRTTFGSISLTATDTIAISWTLTIN